MIKRQSIIILAAIIPTIPAMAQVTTDSKAKAAEVPVMEQSDSAATEQPATIITLEDALKIALSENASVKVADMEVKRTGYARKGSYSALFPQVDGTGSYQRTIKKQVMYMDFDTSSLTGGTSGSSTSGTGTSDTGDSSSSSSKSGFSVGRWNSWSAGVSASMPIVNAQLWESLKISDKDVELAVEKARSSRISTVTQVKQAYFSVLLAKESFSVYKSVYENALDNYELTKKKFNAQRASELDYTRAKTTLANAIPNVYDSENAIMLALWRLKAVMGVDLEMNIDVAGSLEDYAGHMFYDIHSNDDPDLSNNSSLRQLEIQAEQLAETVKMQKAANIPSLALAFSYSYSALANDYKFNEYNWTPYSYAGISLSIPIFAGGKRYQAIRQAKVQASELSINQAETERQLRISIRQDLNTMETAMKSYTSAQSAVESAQKAYSIARKSYEVGRSTLTDLNDAQLALTQSQQGLMQAIYSFVNAKADLEGVLGADLDK